MAWHCNRNRMASLHISEIAIAEFTIALIEQAWHCNCNRNFGAIFFAIFCDFLLVNGEFWICILWIIGC